MKLILLFAGVAVTVAACGGTDRDIEARLETPEIRESKIALRPALDVSNLYDPAIADRIVIEEIELNVSDVRLLGADPRMPTGGFPLLARDVVLEAFDGEAPSLELPFPGYLAEQDDLAVYIRVDRSEALMNASVVIRGRIFAQAVKGGSGSLTATGFEGDDDEGEEEDTGAPKKQKGVEGIDPDGDPAHCFDTDGNPVPCTRRYQLVGRNETSKSIPFELRGEDVADLVTGIDMNVKLDVVIGIPASRWFTPESMSEIDAELHKTAHESDDRVGTRGYETDPVVIEAQMADRAEQAKEELENEEYFAAEARRGIDALKIRRPDRDR